MWRAALTALMWSLIFPSTVLPQQASPPPSNDESVDAPCGPSFATNEQPESPEIKIDRVIFQGVTQLPAQEQDKIASSIREETHAGSVPGTVDGALERARAGWQNHGYFKALVTGKAKLLTGDALNQHVTLYIQVDEGPQYTLGGIVFSNNKVISDTQFLRRLFPIEDGEILGREKIAAGLENLRKAYGKLGYINFTSVPDTVFDDERKLVLLGIDIDEGRQFYLRSFNIVGLDISTTQQLVQEVPINQIYNPETFHMFLEQHLDVLKFHPDEPGHILRGFDERTGAIGITLWVGPCPAE